MSKKCFAPLVNALQIDRLDFELDDTKWKEAFGKPGGCLGGCACCSPAAYCVTRLAIAVVWSSICIWSIADWVGVHDIEFKYWLIYLTHWSAVTEAIYFWLAACTTYQAIYGNIEDGQGASTPWFVQVTWALGPAVVVGSASVFLLYWVLVFKPGPGKPAAISVSTHGVNAALVLVDLLINRQPFYIQHVYVPIVFASLYLFFSLVYFWAGGTNQDNEPYVYKALDWRNGKTTGNLSALIILVAAPILYAVFFCIAAVRKRSRMTSESLCDRYAAEIGRPSETE